MPKLRVFRKTLGVLKTPRVWAYKINFCQNYAKYIPVLFFYVNLYFSFF